MLVSCNLGNASHVDSGDESVGVSTWVEEELGTAKTFFNSTINLIGG